MRLDTFLIADAVTAAESRVYIHAGSLTRLNVPMLPFPVSQLGLYLRLQADKDSELRKKHLLRIVIMGPAGIPNIAPMEFPLMPQELPPLLEGEQRFMDIAINIGGITIYRAGLHNIEVYLDGDLLRSTPLPVQLGMQAPEPEPQSVPKRAPKKRPPAPPKKQARRR